MQISDFGPETQANVKLFGSLELLDRSGRTVKFRTKKTASLFAYLAFHQDIDHSRDVLADLFWPESNVDAARQSLRMALTALRATLDQVSSTGKEFLDTDRTTVRMSNLPTDLMDFVSLSKPPDDFSRLSRAVQIVRGPLLYGLDESWIVAQWLLLEEAYAQAAVRLMNLCSSDKERKSAILSGKEAIALLGPREDVHLALMKLWIDDGQPTQAVAQFEELERLLDEQWGESPSQDAYALLDLVPKGGRTASRAHPSSRVKARITSLYGRDREATLILQTIKDPANRLMTIVGPGGCGKTAIAESVGAEVDANKDKQVWFVELAQLSNPDRILDTVLSAIKGQVDRKPTLEVLAEVLGDEPCLLILDNLEQLLPGAGTVLKSVLGSNPRVQILATSRALVGIQGERSLPLSPLLTPPRGLRMSELREVPSVKLFVDRAMAARPAFELGPDNAVAVSEICRRVEGLPLAIELAAAKVLTHSPAQILAKLSMSLDFLETRKSDAPERQKSLRATLLWSLELLPIEVQSVFASLGIFRGGFDLDSGQAVSGSPMFDQAIERLVECSLVLSSDTEDGVRFRLLEPVREFALESIDPKCLRDLKRRHYDYFLTLSRGDLIGGHGPANRRWLDTLEREHENIYSAFCTVFTGDITPAEAIELEMTCRPFFRPRGHTGLWRDAVIHLGQSLDETVDTLTRSNIQLESAKLASNFVDGPTVRKLYEEALSLAELAGSQRNIAESHCGIGGALKGASLYAESIEHYESAIEAFSRLNDNDSQASTTRQLAMTYVSMGDHDKCYETLKSAIPFARLSDDPDTLAWCLTDVGVEHALHGFVEESKTCFAEAHQICIKTGSSHMRSIVFWQQGETELRTGRANESVATHRLSVEQALKAGFKEGLKWILLTTGAAFIADGQLELGLKVLARVCRWREVEHRNLTGDELEILHPAQETCKLKWGEEKFQMEWAKNENADLDEVIAAVLGQEVHGSVQT